MSISNSVVSDKDGFYERLKTLLNFESFNHTKLIRSLPRDTFYLPSLLPSLALRAFNNHYDLLFDSGKFKHLLRPLPASFGCHNDEDGLALAYLLRPFLQNLLGSEIAIFPSYCYYSIYPVGSNLPPHTDREGCDLTLAIYLADGLPEFQPRTLLSVPTSAEDTAIKGYCGDGVVFYGRDVVHWRNADTTNNCVVRTAMFHFCFQNPLRK